MSTIAQMFAYEDGSLAGGYSTENFMEARVNIRLVMICVEICLRNISCMSVFYNTVTKTCRLHENVFYNTDSFVSEAGWHYYRAVGDPKCDVYNGFVHQRDAGFCYRAESDLLTKTLADSACAAKTSALAILDSQKKQDVVVATLNLLSTKAPAAVQETTVEPVLKGCYSTGHVVNIKKELTNIAMTVQMCFAICQPLGKTHTLLEIECYCGDLQAAATSFPDLTCNKICADGKWCGNLSGMLATYEHVSTSTAGRSQSIEKSI
ncbi:hypothetical protein KP79_PYT18178 [Mizuhopecten yessoensis]|uniref:WSC domain-containing protein n=1 Tax=Mizuhopecten yessoensis TaxID=6573 RepID=A0A210QPV4_MIZYE|nr:hypothetical protein KP79_PYT18178 [Mizuhopecten yessoensis]